MGNLFVCLIYNQREPGLTRLFSIKVYMSHLTKFKTKLDDSKKIERALVYLKLPFKKDEKIRTLNAVPISEFVIISPNGWDIGLQKNTEGTYEVIGDSVSWNGIQNFPSLKFIKKSQGDSRRETFTGILSQAYAITTAMVEAAKLGHTMEVGEPDEQGNITAKIIEYA